MKFEIKHRWNGEILFSIEAENWRFAVEAAIKAKANLSWANLSKADLSKANLSEADLSKANLSKANLSKANLSWANLSKANLSWANLSKANLSKANLSWANLSEADLSKANLSKADLSWANLSKADLSEANLSEADLSKANLSKANLSKANLSFIRTDFFDVLLRTTKEVPALRQALIDGKVDGSHYEGACACLVGTIANAKGCDFKEIQNLKPDSDRPSERFFLAIKEGHTPENNQAAKIAVEWIDEFMSFLPEVYLTK